MLSKFEIALKECSETEGWLQLLFNEEVKRFCRHFDTIEFPIFHREYEYKKILYKKAPTTVRASIFCLIMDKEKCWTLSTAFPKRHFFIKQERVRCIPLP